MKRATLVPAPAMLAVLGLLVSVDYFGVTENFRANGVLLFMSLPLLAFCEFAAFAYDVLKRKDKILSSAFAPRLAIHVIGSVVGVWVLVIWFNLPRLHLG